MQLSCDAIFRPSARLAVMLPLFFICGAIFYSLTGGLPACANEGLNPGYSQEGERQLVPRRKRFSEPPQYQEMEPQAGRPLKWRGQGNEDFGGDGEGRMPPGMERGGGGNRSGHPRQFGGGGRMPGMGPLDLSVLNLSEEQKTKIRTLRENSASRGKELMQSLKQSRLQMRDMMFDPEVSEKTLRSRHAQLKKQEEELGSLMIDDFLSIRSVLTPEQMKHLPELKPQARGPNAARGGGVNRNSAP